MFGFNERIMVNNRDTETQVTFIWETDGAYEYNGFEIEYTISGAFIIILSLHIQGGAKETGHV